MDDKSGESLEPMGEVGEKAQSAQQLPWTTISDTSFGMPIERVAVAECVVPQAFLYNVNRTFLQRLDMTLAHH